MFICFTCSAPALSSRAHKSSLQSTSDDSTSRSPWKSYSNGERSTASEFDDNVSLGGAAPLLKSFVTQVSNLLHIFSLLVIVHVQGTFLQGHVHTYTEFRNMARVCPTLNSDAFHIHVQTIIWILPGNPSRLSMNLYNMNSVWTCRYPILTMNGNRSILFTQIAMTMVRH